MTKLLPLWRLRAALPGDDFCLEDDPADSAGDRMAARLHPGIEVRPPLSRIPSKSYAHVKRAFDIVFSALGLVALSPVLAACAVAVKATSPGAGALQARSAGVGRASRFECLEVPHHARGDPARHARPGFRRQGGVHDAGRATSCGGGPSTSSRSSRTSSRATCR